MTIDSFINKKSYENVVTIIRRHPITFVPYVLIFAILLAVPLAVNWLLDSLFPIFWSGSIIHTVSILFASIYYLSLFLFFYSYFVSFYLDMWVVTNDRLIDVRQTSLFARTVSELDLYQVQDASSEMKGFWASLFKFGTVYLQTAGPVPKFVIYNTPHPETVRQLILNLSSEDKKFHADK